jgi:hypothetical protein
VRASSKALRSAARSDWDAGGVGDAMAGGLLKSREPRLVLRGREDADFGLV